MLKVSMTVNGKPASASVDPRTLLVQYLRENLRLTGTHVGCDTSQCGACVVHMDGEAIKACTILAATCEGSNITTIEGLAKGTQLHPMQEAFRENHGLQHGAHGHGQPALRAPVAPYLAQENGGGERASTGRR